MYSNSVTFLLGSLLFLLLKKIVVQFERHKIDVLSVIEGFEHRSSTCEHVLAEQGLESINNNATMTVIQLKSINQNILTTFKVLIIKNK